MTHFDGQVTRGVRCWECGGEYDRIEEGTGKSEGSLSALPRRLRERAGRVGAMGEIRMTCRWCGSDDDQHDREQLADCCLPARIAILEGALLKIDQILGCCELSGAPCAAHRVIYDVIPRHRAPR